MYYYKSKIETFENGQVVVRFEQKRGNYRDYKVEPKTIGGLSRTHRVIRNTNAIERAQSNVLDIAYRAERSGQQAAERRAKR